SPLKNIDTNPERFDIVTSSKNPNKETKTGLNNLHLKGTQTRPKDQATGFKHIKRCVIGIDFKHAVEFSSFGCIPRLTLSGSAWGNSINLRSSLSRCQTRVPAIFLGIEWPFEGQFFPFRCRSNERQSCLIQPLPSNRRFWLSHPRTNQPCDPGGFSLNAHPTREGEGGWFAFGSSDPEPGSDSSVSPMRLGLH
ncbi:hypothetical protein ACFP57_02515, partial [Luteococcus sanguinis]